MKHCLHNLRIVDPCVLAFLRLCGMMKAMRKEVRHGDRNLGGGR